MLEKPKKTKHIIVINLQIIISKLLIYKYIKTKTLKKHRINLYKQQTYWGRTGKNLRFFLFQQKVVLMFEKSIFLNL
jgi:hypothetical protein